MALLYIAGACVFALLASMVMTRAANRSALWNMGFAVVLLLVLIVVLYAVALLITTATTR